MRRTLLLVDDVRLNREILKNILGSEYGFLEAANGREALDILQQRYRETSAVLLDLGMPVMDGFEVLARMRASDTLKQIPVIVTTGQTDQASEVKALQLGANDYISKPYNATITKQRIWNVIHLRETAALVNELQRDRLTGLYNRAAFFDQVERMVAEHEAGYYVMASFDIDNFKIVNDQYGAEKGDEVLRYVARVFMETFDPNGGVCCRISADNFAVLYPKTFASDPRIADARERASAAGGLLASPLAYSIGRYVVDDLTLTGSAMYDRAMLAEAVVKGRYDEHIYEYRESMREQLLQEQRIIADMRCALAERQFEAWFQPQYNHVTGALIGAEVLARWRHPQKGLIPPGTFIPVFERNGFVYELDKFIWEEACRHLRKWLNEGRNPLPLAVNISRYDIFRADLIDTIQGLLARYRLPVEMLRLEVTESAFAYSTERIIAIVKQLIELGFTVEIDDFGSGYSSLNTLKDVPAQVLKLDMRFLENNENSQRGGNILESIVRMAKWLGMSVIAEGVETVEQADYLRSIGCSYIQGFLYARPMPASDYEARARWMSKEERLLTLQTVENLDNNAFWDPKSMDTLIFNSYVGGACICEYQNGKLELLRANEKYVQAYGAGVTIDDIFGKEAAGRMDERNRDILAACVREAVETGQEATCETMERGIRDPEERLYMRSTLRVIARAGERCLLYGTLFNVTARREAEQRRAALADQLSAIMDNINAGVSVSVVEEGVVNIIFANDRYYEDLGYTRMRYEAENIDIFSIIHPDDINDVKESVRRAREDRRAYHVEYRVMRPDGRLMWLSSGTSIMEYPGVDVPVYLTVSTDITAIKQAEQSLREADDQLRFLNSTANALLAQPDSERGAREVLGRILAYFSGARVTVFEFDRAGEALSATYELCAEGVPGAREQLQGIPRATLAGTIRAFETQNYLSIPDVDAMGEDMAPARQRIRSRGARSVIAVPLRRDGALIGFVIADDPQEHFDGIDRLAALGDYITVMLTRRDLNARIRDEAVELLDNLPTGAGLFRYDGKTITPLHINKRYWQLVKRAPTPYPETPVLAAIHPDDSAAVIPELNAAIREGRDAVWVNRLRYGADEWRPFRATCRIVPGPGGLYALYTSYEMLSRDGERP